MRRMFCTYTAAEKSGMDKKGMMAFVTLVGLIFAIMVVCVLFFAAVNLGGSAKVRNRMVMAKDIALGLDAAFSTKQEARVLVNYPNTINDRDVMAADNLVSIYPTGQYNALGVPSYPFTQNSYYKQLKETEALNIVVFAKDADEVALHPLVQALPASIEDVDTKADPKTQTVKVITDDPQLQGAVGQALQVEGFTVSDSNPTMILRLERSPLGGVQITYGNADPSTSRKEKKLAELVQAAFGTAGLIEDLTATGDVPYITVAVPKDEGAQDVANKLAVAVMRYYS